MTPDCIFCQIAAGQTLTNLLYQDEQVTAFRDIHPVAPTHILIIPNRHITSTNETGPQDEALLGHLINVARRLAEQEKIAANGYRLVINTGADGGQVVFHLHLHLIGGRKLVHP